MNDGSVYRISNGVLVAPFLDGAVAVDLVEERTHVLGRVGGWLLSQSSPVDVSTLITEIPDTDKPDFVHAIDDALATLRGLGLVERTAVYIRPELPGDSAAPVPGAHTGTTHAVVNRRIAFRSDDTELLGRIDEFVGGAVDEPATRFFDVERDGDTIVLFAADRWEFENENRLLTMLPVVCNDDAARTHGITVIHAGGVRTPDGRILALVGTSNAGKSTLTAALVAAGCDYLGDESIGIAGDGVVHAYPKPMTLDAASRRLLGLDASEFPHVRPDEIRSDVVQVTTATSVDEVLLVRYDPDHTGMCSGRPLDPASALEAVLANVLNVARGGEDGLMAVCNLVESVPVVPFTHPGVATAVDVILGH